MTEILNVEALQHAVEESPGKCRYCLKPLRIYKFEGMLDAVNHILAHPEVEPEARNGLEKTREWLEAVCALPEEKKAEVATSLMVDYLSEPKNREKLTQDGFLTRVRHG